MSTPAILALQDGTVFHGTSIGADGQTIGEVVFNTAMTGYQEILTDPSYCRQNRGHSPIRISAIRAPTAMIWSPTAFMRPG